jgi:transposase
MYTRIKRVKNSKGEWREYLLLVESKRINGQVRQKTIANLGRLDIIAKTNMADVLVEKLLEYTKQKQLMDLAATQAEYAKEYGAVLVLRRLWEILGFDKFFAECLGRYKYRADLKESLLAIVINRLLEPKSEHAIEKWLEDVYEQRWEKLELQHLYRGLDFLERHWTDFEKDFFLKVTDLFSQELDLIMFDTTTIKYWGEGKEAEILQHGYSKDKRGDLKQLIVGVLMSKDGYPVAVELLPGNTPDVKSFIEVVKTLKTRYNIGKIIWVCDRGMVSKKNLEELREFKQEYIFGVRMRQFDKETRQELLNPKDMWEVKDNLYVKEVYKEGIGRYIVCFNPEEKELKHHKRIAFKRHLNKKLAASSPKDWMIKNGYKKYVDFKGTVSLSEKKLYEEGQYDGYWVLLTSTTMETRDAALRYKDLWQIEHGFRDLKSELETSPIFHYKERRIKAHVHVCFLALILKITLEKRIKAVEPTCSYLEVLDALKRIKAVKLTSGKDEIIFRTEFPEKAYLAFKALNLAPPPRILVYNKSKDVVSRPEGV